MYTLWEDPELDYWTNNILNEEMFKILKNRFSCSIFDWKCKPKNIFCKINDFSELTEGLVEEIIEKIQQLLLNGNINKLTVKGKNFTLPNANYLSVIEKALPQIKISLDFWDKYKLNTKINARQVICVFQGREWCLKSTDERFSKFRWEATNIEQDRDSKAIALKSERIYFKSFNFSGRIRPSNAKQSFIKKLKKNTESNNDLYIIADVNTLSFYLSLKKLKDYEEILKYFKHISISLSNCDLDYENNFDIINALSKDKAYELNIDAVDWKEFTIFNKIDSSFKDMKINLTKKGLTIKILKSRSTPEEENLGRMFKVYYKWNPYSRILNFEELLKTIMETENFNPYAGFRSKH